MLLFQVLKSSFQEVLSSRVRGTSHLLFSYCVHHTLCEKYGSDMYSMHPSIAGYFAYFTKAVSCSLVFTTFNLSLSSDIYEVLNTGIHSARYLKLRPLK